MSYKRSPRLNVFDYLISNHDRNFGNILIYDGKEVAIDHGLTLRRVNSLGHFLDSADRIFNVLGMQVHPIRQVFVHPKTHIYEFLAEPKLFRRLCNSSKQQLEKNLKGILAIEKIKKINKKRLSLLQYLGKLDPDLCKNSKQNSDPFDYS